MERNEILIISGENYAEMTRTLLEEADLAGQIGDPEKRIGIKPNLVSPTPAFLGATTHPEVVAGLIDYLKAHGFLNLVILESSWVGAPTGEAYEYCGYRALCESTGVPFWDLQKDRGVMRDCAGMNLSVCASTEKIDFLIGVPVLKGHGQTKVTCALKNMKGLLPNAEKRRFHAMGLHGPIAHLNAFVRQDFVLVDNICGDLDFEDGGNPYPMNRVLAGTDPVLIDAYAANLLHYEVSEIPYISQAQALGVGSADLEKARIRFLSGEGEQVVPLSRKLVELSEFVEEVDSCSACYASLIPALDRLREEGWVPGEEVKISIGQGFRGKTGAVGIGICTRFFDQSLPGCPPDEEAVYAFLKTLPLMRA